MKIVVMSAVHSAGLELLRKRTGLELTVLTDLPEPERAKALQQANVILVRTQPLPGELLNKVADLRFIAKHGVGCDNIDLATAAALGVPVANTPGANANAVAEHTIALMLASARRIIDRDQFVRDGGTPGWQEGSFGELRDKTLVIVGFGTIGRRVAELAKAFRMRVIVVSRPSTDPDARDAQCDVLNFDDALKEADYLSLHVPLTEETRNLVGARAISLMKPSAVVVSLARGGVVNEFELAAALHEGRIGGACLDVFETEPLPTRSALMETPNTLLSPHIGALSDQATRQMAVHAAQNILDWMDGTLPDSAIVNHPVARLDRVAG